MCANLQTHETVYIKYVQFFCMSIISIKWFLKSQLAEIFSLVPNADCLEWIPGFEALAVKAGCLF